MTLKQDKRFAEAERRIPKIGVDLQRATEVPLGAPMLAFGIGNLAQIEMNVGVGRQVLERSFEVATCPRQIAGLSLVDAKFQLQLMNRRKSGDCLSVETAGVIGPPRRRSVSRAVNDGRTVAQEALS